MYIRQISRKNKDGSRIRYLQLAHKFRDPDTGRPRDEILCHLGREDQIDREQILRLIKSLSRFLDPASQLATQGKLEGHGWDLQLASSMPLGGSYVLDALWRRLGIRDTLRKLLKSRAFGSDVERHLFALVANRALQPRSKLSVERWVGRKVWIQGLQEVSVHNLYRAMDVLAAHHEEIQKSVFFSVASLLNLEVDLLFFDTTSTYFEIEEEDEDGLRRYGHSKDHRSDAPQAVIGLAVTRDGLPVRCWVLKGNASDAGLVDGIQKDMAGWKLNRVVWVVDRGMAGAKQRVAFQRGGGHVIVGEKLRNGPKENREALARRGKYAKVRDDLEVKEVTIRKGSLERRFFVMRNPSEAKRDLARRENALGRLQDELDHLNDGRRRRGAGHSKAVCALRTHPRMGRFIRELKDGQLRIDRKAIKEDAKLDGKYLISCTDPSLPAEDVALGYKQLWQVERAFRTLKTTLDLRPLYHRKDERIQSHIILCWLALLLVRYIENETGMSWELARDELEDIQRAKLFNKDGEILITSTLSEAQRDLLNALQIPFPKRIQAVQGS